jgi:hypothetical protein
MEHAAQAPAWAVALQESGLGLGIRNALWIYPLANILHVFGVILLVGPIVALDLRLLGVGRFISAAAAARFLTPFAVAGILLVAPTGFTLFTADAASLSSNTVLQIKLALVVFGIANAIAFRLWWRGRLAGWDDDAPALGRAQAALSIAIWLSVPALGRLIAYL